KQVMGIQTDSTPLEEPKNPDSCNVFNIYKLVASEEQIEQMRQNYEAGGYGYGHAKQDLYELLIEKYQVERERFVHYMENREELDAALKKGAEKARTVARGVLNRVRKTLGY